MRIRFLSNTNIRSSTRDFSVPPLGVIFAGTEIEVDDRLYRGRELDGINTYFRDNMGWYYWSGRVAIIYKAIAAPSVERPSPPEDQERIGGDWNIRVQDPDVPEEVVTEPKPVRADKQIVIPDIAPVLQSFREAITPTGTRAIPPVAPLPENQDQEFRYEAGLVNWGLEKYQIPPNWWEREQLSGKGVRVAILDTGVDTAHPDLSAAIKQVYNCCGLNTMNMSDVDGHGTRCAGLLAGQGRQQYLGVAPGVSLWVAKVMEHSLDLQVDRIWNALDWVFRFPVDIVLFGFDVRLETMSREQRIRFQSYMDRAFSKSIMVIAPAGESSGNRTEDRFPAGYSQVLGVGGHDRQGQRLINGVRSYHLNLLAPATDLFPGTTTAGLSGESAYGATFTSGVLSMAMEFAQKNHLRYSVADWQQLITQSAKAKFQLTKCKDVEYGCGLLDPPALLKALWAEIGEHAADRENE